MGSVLGLDLILFLNFGLFCPGSGRAQGVYFGMPKTTIIDVKASHTCSFYFKNKIKIYFQESRNLIYIPRLRNVRSYSDRLANKSNTVAPAIRDKLEKESRWFCRLDSSKRGRRDQESKRV